MLVAGILGTGQHSCASGGEGGGRREQLRDPQNFR